MKATSRHVHLRRTLARKSETIARKEIVAGSGIAVSTTILSMLQLLGPFVIVMRNLSSNLKGLGLVAVVKWPPIPTASVKNNTRDPRRYPSICIRTTPDGIDKYPFAKSTLWKLKNPVVS